MKTYGRFLAVIVMIGALSSCSDTGLQFEENLTQRTGSLFFSLSKASAPSDINWIVARLENAGFPTIIDSVNISSVVDTALLRIQYIQPGTWLLTVEAKDSTGEVRYKGSTSVTIEKGLMTTVTLELDPLFGSLDIHIFWTTPPSTWVVYANNPIIKQTPASWDQDHFFFGNPEVLKINGLYRMWYTSGYNQYTNGFDRTWIAYATSADGINWTKHGAVINPGLVGSWNEKGSVHPNVLYDNGVFKMWFAGNSAVTFGSAIAYAVSNDGITWNIQPQLVLQSSATRPELRHPEILKRNDGYYLYYTAGALAANEVAIYLMTSVDGLQWTDRGKVLSRRTGLSWETQGVAAASVIYEQNRYYMYYSGVAGNEGAIGYAESADGINWMSRSTVPLLTPSQTGLWHTTAVGYASVLRDGNRLKMWFSGLSQTPYRWEIGYAEQK